MWFDCVSRISCGVSANRLFFFSSLLSAHVSECQLFNRKTVTFCDHNDCLSISIQNKKLLFKEKHLNLVFDISTQHLISSVVLKKCTWFNLGIDSFYSEPFFLSPSKYLTLKMKLGHFVRSNCIELCVRVFVVGFGAEIELMNIFFYLNGIFWYRTCVWMHSSYIVYKHRLMSESSQSHACE